MVIAWSTALGKLAEVESLMAAFGPEQGVSSNDKLARFTVRPCTQTTDVRPVFVILVPPSSDIALGFDMARRRLARGECVRLVGMGLTLSRVWPSWVTGTPGLWITELTAYRNKTRWESTRALRESLEALSDELFAGILPRLRGAEVFYPHIGKRAFRRVAFIMPIALGLAEHHALDVVTCTRPEWPGFDLFRALAGLSPLRRSHWVWVVRVAGLATAAWAASFVRVAALYVRSRVGLKELRRRRSASGVKLWVQLFTDVDRINRPLIAATRGQDIGILLHGYLGRGERHEHRLSKRRGRELWAGLRSIDSSHVQAWDTTSIPASFTQFGRTCVTFTRNSGRAALRLCRHGPLLKVGSCHLDLVPYATDLVKLLTLDMARVCMADTAVSNILQNHDFRGATVLSAGAGSSDVALLMRRLHLAGATTIDFAHGISFEPEPFTDDLTCGYRCVWVQANAVDGDSRFLVGGMPVPARLPRPNGSSRPRVLVMSNYLHRDDMVYEVGFEAYQDELLDVIRRRSDQYDFRWRPHPADRPAAVLRAAEGLPAEISRTRSFAEDLAWADVGISTTRSATVAEALLLDIPVLVHVTPDVEGSVMMAPFSSDRTFFSAVDGVEKLDAVVAALATPDLLTPDRRTRVALFGEAEVPRSLRQAIAPLMPNGAGPIAVDFN